MIGRPQLKVSLVEIAYCACIMFGIALALCAVALIMAYCQYYRALFLQRQRRRRASPPPGRRQNYGTSPNEMEEGDGYFRRHGREPHLWGGVFESVSSVSATSMLAVYYNHDMTELILTNPHVFVVFALSAECKFEL